VKQNKIALFGGTFDPVHNGHIGVAASAIHIIGADRLIFIPARRSALKSASPVASDADRLAMLELAVEDSKKFEVSDWELARPAPSYTIETVRHFGDELGTGVALYWLIGADAVDELGRWYEIREVIDRCFLTCMRRPGCDAPDFSRLADALGPDRVKKLQDNIIDTPLIDVSSTQIRARLAGGQDVRGMVGPAVADYIREHRLYR
jgi:nicotinate-nucleotide adenylyltransferase